MTPELTNIYEREGRKVWLREHPEWDRMRDWYTAESFRWNTYRIMHWYRVPL